MGGEHDGRECANVDGINAGSRVVMRPGTRWQGVGTVATLHSSGLTCAVKWDSGRLDRTLKISDLIVKQPSSPAGKGSMTSSPASSSQKDRNQSPRNQEFKNHDIIEASEESRTQSTAPSQEPNASSHTEPTPKGAHALRSPSPATHSTRDPLVSSPAALILAAALIAVGAHFAIRGMGSYSQVFKALMNKVT